MKPLWIKHAAGAVAIAGLGLAIAALPGCGKAAEVAVETATEKAVESETGGDAQVDIDSETGNISIKSAGGEQSLDINSQGG